jgi:alkylation response protein AidB-like acyl-CoA dehydrogenase
MKHIVITSDQQLLRESAERFLRDRYGFEHRETMRQSTEGFDPGAWRSFAELGWLGLPFPGDLGGFEGSMLDVALLAEVLGPALIAEPYMPTIAAGTAVLAASEALRNEVIPAICEGRLKLALAFAERASGYEVSSPDTTATSHNGGFRLTGVKSVVLGAPLADALVVSAKIDADAELSLFLVPTGATGVERRSYATIDGQRAAEVTLDGVEVGPDRMVGERGKGLPVLRRAMDAGTVMLLGEAAGIVRAALELTAQYLNTREQFGRKLATFQALRHRVALMFVGSEEVRALCRQAAAEFADDPDADDAREAIAAAKVHVGRLGRHICEEAIQLHGAIAISDEYVAGHFLKRMVTIDHMFGSANHHFDRYVEIVRTLRPR